MENGAGGRGVGRGGGGGPLPDNWELAFSDSGEPYYIELVMTTIKNNNHCLIYSSVLLSADF